VRGFNFEIVLDGSSSVKCISVYLKSSGVHVWQVCVISLPEVDINYEQHVIY
jgi:hypothetical protein